MISVELRIKTCKKKKKKTTTNAWRIKHHRQWGQQKLTENSIGERSTAKVKGHHLRTFLLFYLKILNVNLKYFNV